MHLKHAFLFIAFFYPFAISAQQAPKTKVESFSIQYGSVVISGYTEEGVLEALGTITVKSWEFKAPSLAKKEYGVSINVKSAGRLPSENISYIDYDELDSFIKGFDYITKLDKTVTKLENFQANYKTKGDLELSSFSDSDGSTSLAVKSGSIGRATVYLNKDNFNLFRNLIIKAKSQIDSIK